MSDEIPSFVHEWFSRLESPTLTAVTPQADCAAVVSVDMVVGFCQAGSLASERVGTLADPVARLFQHAHGTESGTSCCSRMPMPRTHRNSRPIHLIGIRDTHEAETIGALRHLPFAHEFAIFPKNSLNPGIETGFEAWLRQHSRLQTTIVVGNCTDLCVYQVVMYLRLRANALNLKDFRVVVPAETVDTYDLSIQIARQRQAYPHPGDFFHQVFLYHLALNGVEVYRTLT